MSKYHGKIIPRTSTISQPRKVKKEKIKIGYLSPDINKNAVSLFIGPLFEHYNKDLFEIYVFYNNDK
jgi:predicted O-linked N-acetylglucosamine transferase (SPINDLY family)